MERIAFDSFEELPNLEYLDLLIRELTNESGRLRKDGKFADAAERQHQAGKFADYALSLAPTFGEDRLLKRNQIYDRYIRLLFELGRFEEAERVYQAVFAAHSSDLLAPGESRTLRMRVLSGAGRPEEALTHIDALVEANLLDEHNALSMRCKVKLDRGEVRKAAADCEAALAIRSSGEARFHYGQYFESQNQLRAAIDQYRLAQRSGLHPFDYEFAKRRLAKLEKRYFKTVQIDPNVEFIISEQICGGLAKQSSSPWVEVVPRICRDYGDSIKDGRIPSHTAFFNLSKAAAYVEEQDLALAVIEEGLRFDSRKLLIAFQIYLLIELEREDEGYLIYDEYSEMHGQNESAALLNEIIDSSEDLNHFGALIRLLDYALVSSSNQLAERRSEFLRRRAELLHLDGQWERAIKDYEAVSEQFSEDPYIPYVLCSLNLQIQNFPDALEYCESALAKLEGMGFPEIFGLNLAVQAALANDASDLVESYFNRCLAIQRPEASGYAYSWGPLNSNGYPVCEDPYEREKAN